eukprot:15364521-Ditylum_brightwellii.AAC.1
MTPEQETLLPTAVPVLDVNHTHNYLQIRQPSPLHILLTISPSHLTSVTEYMEDLDLWEYNLIQGYKLMAEKKMGWGTLDG